MKIKFIKPKTISKSVKATIHRTGLLGFSTAAAKKLNLNSNKSIRIGMNEEDNSDKNLYIELIDGIQEDSLKVNKAGNYYYVNTKALFDDLQVDFRSLNIIFDIIEYDYEEKNMYKFIRREYPRKKEKSNE
jgi:hypothetical protein